MNQKTIGEILRAEREFHQLSIQDLAKKTRIRVQYLKALEANKFDQLPTATFVKGYIKTYARIFGFNDQPLLAMLRRDFEESARGTLVPREFIKPVLRRKRWLSPATMAFVVAATVVATLASYVAYQWYQLQQPPVVEIFTPDAQSVVGPEVVVTGQTELEATVTINDIPTALQPDGTFRTELFMQQEGLATITVEAVDRRGKVGRDQRLVRVEF